MLQAQFGPIKYPSQRSISLGASSTSSADSNKCRSPTVAGSQRSHQKCAWIKIQRVETSAELSLIFKTNGFWKDLPAVEAFFTFFLQCRIADAFTKYFFSFLDLRNGQLFNLQRVTEKKVSESSATKFNFPSFLLLNFSKIVERSVNIQTQKPPPLI